MLNKNLITDLFFDLDHTIYDFDKNATLTFQAAFSELNITGVQEFMFFFKPINDAYWEKFVRNEITREHLRFARLKDTFDAINLKVSEEKIRSISEYFVMNLTRNNYLIEGALETLNYLLPKYRLHIISNGPKKVQERKIKNTGLTDFFQTLTVPETAGFQKPHPEIFRSAMHSAGTKTEQSIMIGDNLFTDVSGALNAGMNVIWLNELNKKNEFNTIEIQKLRELKNIL